MHGIKLITQMIFLLLCFIFPVSDQPDTVDLPERDMSFMYSDVGGFHAQIEEKADLEEPAPAALEADETDNPGETIQWENEYEIPVAGGNAMITSQYYKIVAGPYEGITVTSEEVEMMEYVIQRETNGTLKHRKIIAELILNRVASERFPDSVKEVLTAPRQFSTVNNYYSKKRPPDELTKQAVYEVLVGEGSYHSDGALFFYDPVYADRSSAGWFENSLGFLFELEGHRFFK